MRAAIIAVVLLIAAASAANLTACTMADHNKCAISEFGIVNMLCVDPASVNNCDPATRGKEICVADKWTKAYDCYFATPCDPTDTLNKTCTGIFQPLCGANFTTWLCNLQQEYLARGAITPAPSSASFGTVAIAIVAAVAAILA